MAENKTPWIVPGRWSTSMYNWLPEIRKNWKLPSKITIHDVTLRDGEQTPGVVFRTEEKVQIAKALAAAGVPRIEGGMVAVSEEDAEAVRRMSKELKDVEIATFCRVVKSDVDGALACGARRLIIELVCLDRRIKYIWGTREKAVQAVIDLLQYAKSKGVKTTLFLMETTRADLDFLKSFIVPPVQQGKPDSVCLVDTRGCAIPEAVSYLVKQVKEWVDVPVEFHGHNNWGLGTANSLAAAAAGADVIHCCVNGMNGNAALEETVMVLEGLGGVNTGVDTRHLVPLSEKVMKLSGSGYYKPFVAPILTSVEAGIAHREMWEMRDKPGMGRADALNFEMLGRPGVTVALGKKSGRHSVMLRLWQRGIPIPPEDKLDAMLDQVKKTSIANKRLVTEEEFEQIRKQVMGA